MPKSLLLFAIISLIVAAIGPVHCFQHWAGLPDQIPSHFNAAGEVDRWGPKGDPIMMLILNAAVFLVFSLLEWLMTYLESSSTGTRKSTCHIMQIAFGLFKIQTLSLISFLEYSIVQIAAAHGGTLPGWLAPAFFGSFFLIFLGMLVLLMKASLSKA